MNAKQTCDPGLVPPLKADGQFVVVADSKAARGVHQSGKYAAQCYDTCSTATHGSTKGGDWAKLFASAPALLAACKAARNRLDVIWAQAGGADRVNLSELRELEIAIAAAKGQ